MKRRVPYRHSVRDVAVLGVLAVSLLAGPGCDSDGTGGRAASDAGVDAAAGVGGSAGASGAPGVGGRPPIPPATVESCGALAFTFDGGGCSSVCASVRCDCEPFPSTYI